MELEQERVQAMAKEPGTVRAKVTARGKGLAPALANWSPTVREQPRRRLHRRQPGTQRSVRQATNARCAPISEPV